MNPKKYKTLIKQINLQGTILSIDSWKEDLLYVDMRHKRVYSQTITPDKS